MTIFERPDPERALREYLELLEERPELVGDRSNLQVVTSYEQLRSHVDEHGDALGLILRSPFGIVLVDLVESGEIRFPYVRVVPATRHLSTSGVVVIAVTDKDELVMVESLRHATGQVHLELPRGFVGPGEDPITAGLRELQEETGFVSESGRLIGSSYTDTGLTAGRVGFVYTTDVAAGPSAPELEEAIESVRLVPLVELPKMAEQQLVDDGFTLQATGLLFSSGLLGT